VVNAQLTSINDGVVLWIAASRISDHLTNSCPFLHVQTTDYQEKDEYHHKGRRNGYANYHPKCPVERDTSKHYQMNKMSAYIGRVRYMNIHVALNDGVTGS